MPIQNVAPYAPPKTVISLIDRYRNRGLQTPLDLGVLTRAGVSESLAPRTLQALKLLDLIDEAGNPMQALEALRLARTEEYKQRFAEFLRGAYSEVFSFVDPSEDDDEAIRDAFRSYLPHGQQGRMVTLFLGLAAHAGLRSEATNGSGREAPAPRRTAPPPPRRRSSAPLPQAAPVQSVQAAPERSASPLPAGGSLPPAVTGLLLSLPPEGEGWSQSKRERFLATFAAVLDFVYPIEPEEQQKLSL